MTSLPGVKDRTFSAIVIFSETVAFSRRFAK